MSKENETDNQINTEVSNKGKAPDYWAVQYRLIAKEDGWVERSERIGAAWSKENGGITFRPAGRQIIDDDIHFVINSDHIE